MSTTHWQRIAAGFGTMLVLLICCPLGTAQPTKNDSNKRAGAYPLATWKTFSCRAKGRFQDPDYCQSAVMDHIVADGKSAIPVLISQITDASLIAEPVYDYWPCFTVGQLAYLILQDLFTDETWTKSTMPQLFVQEKCDGAIPGWECWKNFRKTHSMKTLQSRWMKFWNTNQRRIYWDKKGRCFRLADRQ